MASTIIITAVGDRTGGGASPMMTVGRSVGATVAARIAALNRQTT